jgi:hypothetical protein
LSWATYITAADSGVLDIDDHIVRVFQLGNWAILELDPEDALQDKGEVLYPATLAVSRGLVQSSPYLSRCGSHCLRVMRREEEKKRREEEVEINDRLPAKCEK